MNLMRALLERCDWSRVSSRVVTLSHACPIIVFRTRTSRIGNLKRRSLHQLANPCKSPVQSILTILTPSYLNIRENRTLGNDSFCVNPSHVLKKISMTTERTTNDFHSLCFARPLLLSAYSVLSTTLATPHVLHYNVSATKSSHFKRRRHISGLDPSSLENTYLSYPPLFFHTRQYPLQPSQS